jgi:hypothetical protein
MSYGYLFYCWYNHNNKDLVPNKLRQASDETHKTGHKRPNKSFIWGFISIRMVKNSWLAKPITTPSFPRLGTGYVGTT